MRHCRNITVTTSFFQNTITRERSFKRPFYCSFWHRINENLLANRSTTKNLFALLFWLSDEQLVVLGLHHFCISSNLHSTHRNHLLGSQKQQTHTFLSNRSSDWINHCKKWRDSHTPNNPNSQSIKDASSTVEISPQARHQMDNLYILVCNQEVIAMWSCQKTVKLWIQLAKQELVRGRPLSQKSACLLFTVLVRSITLSIFFWKFFTP